MKRALSITSFFVITALLSGESNAKNSWERDGRENGITVYTKPVNSSKVPMVKAVTIVDASPEKVWDVINKGDMKVNGLKERRKIGTCGDTCEMIYVRLGNFLIEDRHYVVRIRSISKDVNGETHYMRDWKKSSDRKPPGKAAMEVKYISGSWILEPIDGGTKTRLTYFNHLDLGGSVPSVFFAPKFVAKTYDILSHVKNGA